MFDDFRIKFICRFDGSFFLHVIREFLLTIVFSIISIEAGIFFAFGFDCAWEWQDGLRNDGFNVLDFLAGIIGIVLGVLCRSI